MRLALVFAALLLLMSTPAASTTPIDYTTHWTHLVDTELNRFLYDCGGAADLAVKGNMAYLVDSYAGLQVIDCTDPNDAILRGFVWINNPVACGVRDHYAYVATGSQITVVDIDDHDAPTVIGAVPTGGPVRDLAVSGPWLYLLHAGDTLQIFSLAQASAPALTRTVALPAGSSRRLDIDGGRLYVVGDGNLAAYDASVPDWPSLLGTLASSGAVHGFDVRGDLALIGHTDDSRLLDVSDPAAMAEVSWLGVPGLGVLLTSGGEAWTGQDFCWSQSGLNVVDISDPSAPELLHQEIWGFRGWPQAMVEYQGLVYAGEYMCWCAGEWPGFHILRPGALPLPAALATESPDGVFGVLTRGTVAEVGTRQGIAVWDLADPAAPQLVETIEPTSGFLWFAQADGLVASCRDGAWLSLFDRDGEGRLRARGEVAIEYYPAAIALSADLALLAYDTWTGQGTGLVVVDVHDPDAPAVLGELYAEENVRGIAIHGHLAAMSTREALRILDLADPLQPVLLAEVPHAQYWHLTSLDFLEREGRLLLAAARNRGSSNYGGGYAEVFDLTDPASPQCLVSLRQLGTSEVGPLIWQDDLLVVPGSIDLTFYRWPSLDQAPAFAGRVPLITSTAYASWPFAALAGQAVLAGTNPFPEGTLTTWPLPTGVLTAAPEAAPAIAAGSLTAAPNPFNPGCTLRFALAAAGPITVRVFDPRGRLVRTLLAEARGPGWHDVRWDGLDDVGRPAASGVYLARVRAAGTVETAKLALTR